ncbi:hypothetical protein LWI28_015920 [Acer negundo]|uniref:Uncharacterized protein n=1 Tax=Acer negundo TaxID=4023 RepID=A0AAD5JAU5_ACENE|nr:hypothetical protein LWI28_015920 [Acer negundo]
MIRLRYEFMLCARIGESPCLRHLESTTGGGSFSSDVVAKGRNHLQLKEARGEMPMSEETFNVGRLLQHRRRTTPPLVTPTPEEEQFAPPSAFEEALSSSMDANKGLASSFGH